MKLPSRLVQVFSILFAGILTMAAFVPNIVSAEEIRSLEGYLTGYPAAENYVYVGETFTYTIVPALGVTIKKFEVFLVNDDGSKTAWSSSPGDVFYGVGGWGVWTDSSDAGRSYIIVYRITLADGTVFQSPDITFNVFDGSRPAWLGFSQTGWRYAENMGWFWPIEEAYGWYYWYDTDSWVYVYPGADSTDQNMYIYMFSDKVAGGGGWIYTNPDFWGWYWDYSTVSWKCWVN